MTIDQLYAHVEQLPWCDLDVGLPFDTETMTHAIITNYKEYRGQYVDERFT